MARKSSDYIQMYLDHGIDIPGRRIDMTSYSDAEGNEAGVDWQLADRVIRGLHLLGNSEQPITLLINNFGGEDDHARAIIGAIRNCKAPVYGLVYGRAESAAAWILQHCGHRTMDRHSSLMLHMGASNKDHHSEYIDSLFVEDILARIREKDPKYKESALRRQLKIDWNLYPSEALKLGLIDEVLK
jgi:ATP-dependent protease ClpP protease subunit